MIKVSLSDIINSASTFRELSEKQLPIRVAFRIARLIRELDKENATFESSRKAIIEKYAMRDEAGKIAQANDGNIILQQNKIEDCNNEWNELLSAEVEINADKISIEDLENIEMTPAQVYNIEAFIE